MNEITIDQKLKAIEIASQIVTTSGPEENSSQEEFNQHMDEYISCIAGIATLILRKAVSMQV